MKKIYTIMVLFFSLDAYGARTPFGNALATYQNIPAYLIDAADAWGSVAESMGPSGLVKQTMSNTYNTDVPLFHDIVSVIAYNDTALVLFETTQHVGEAFADLTRPMASRRTACVWENGKCTDTRRAFIIDGHVFGRLSSYDSKFNGDFETKTGGFTISAKGYLSDGFLVGVGYTRNITDTKDSRVYTDTTSNSVTAVAQYLSAGGAFINAGVNVGHTSWTTDKSVAGIQTPEDFDTDFMAGQLTAGVQVMRGQIFIVPQFGARYIFSETEKHTDAIVQTFNDWHHNTLSALADIRLGMEFRGSDYSLRPNIVLGGSYDMITNGNDAVQVQVINGATYFIPVEVPARLGFNTGLGLSLQTPMFTIGFDYKFDIRKDFWAHNAMVNLKLAF